MTSESGWRAFSGPLLLLLLIYLVWFVRYPTWQWFEYAEPLFVMLISSYLVVLVLSIFFLKKDARKTLSELLKTHGYKIVLASIVFAFLFQAIWFSISLGVGSRLEFVAFPSLKGYESYAVYSITLALVLYLTFAIFGAFVEEVAFRGYIQPRIASRHGQAMGVFVASLFFSLEHIHIFDLNWIEKFFQTQFIYVFSFGIFAGYLFLKSKENIWSVFAFHALGNIFNVSLPIQVTPAFPLANQSVTIITFLLMDSDSPIFLLFSLHKNKDFLTSHNTLSSATYSIALPP